MMEGFLETISSLAPGFLWMVVFFIIAFTALVAVILSYHWREYSIDMHRKNRMFRGYMTIAGILILIMIFNLVLYLY